ncbi:SGNH/GDSL hydrolase family protein [Pseudonocardia sp. ICBG1293]|uniref:SGNH/GDSL hydrolase family protein n=1 Tax=Pseudonocardia sp. ICBG1293 TaxID=2844382 RepID=UPI001CCC1FE6|nr:SGNH/GDSL hydrolase family protein [Pseudonocardia sp. ICBG1293]
MTARPSVVDPALRPARPVTAPCAAGRPVRHLVLLGDSTAVGLGDPLPGGGWRGFGPLLRDALDDPAHPGSVRLDNHARTGARMAEVRHGQVPAAAMSGPDVVVLCAGMNDTLRSDFDPAGIRRDCAGSLEPLLRTGATVLLLRFHDHARVWPLPGPLQRALATRIAALNGAVDGAVADAVAATGRSAVGILDLDTAGSYDPAAWSVDRLHPSERGHRRLARGFAGLLGAAGFAVPGEVGLDAAGGRAVAAWQRGAWLVVQGVPWLVRRTRDLGPVMVRGLVEGARERKVPA